MKSLIDIDFYKIEEFIKVKEVVKAAEPEPEPVQEQE